MYDADDKGRSPDKKIEHDRDPILEQTADFILAEYNMLRTELLQRVATRYQIMALAFSAFSAILAVQAFGAGSAAGLYLVLLYPILAFFLLNVYLSNSRNMKNIEKYIKTNIEACVKEKMQSPFKENFGWQTYYDASHGGFKRIQFSNLGGRFIFPVTAIVTVIAAFPGVWFDQSANKLPFLYLLFCVAIVVLLVSFAQAIWDNVADIASEIPPDERKHLLKNIWAEIRKKRIAPTTKAPAPDLE